MKKVFRKQYNGILNKDEDIFPPYSFDFFGVEQSQWIFAIFYDYLVNK